jgi:hypothetical protein
MGKTIRLFGKLPTSPSAIIDATYYRKGRTTLTQIKTDALGRWEGDFESNDAGDFASYYTFAFPNGLTRRVFLSGNLPKAIDFAVLGGTSEPTEAPAPNTSALDALDPDKYLGTLGLLADKRVGSAKPHYTSFPAADAGAWLLVVSETKLDGRDLLIDQNWMCLADGTPANTPAKWELTQRGTKRPEYATYASNIGEMVRVANPMTLQSETAKRVSWKPAFRADGVFAEPYRLDTQKNAFYTDLYDLINQGIRIDYRLDIEFAPNTNGDRNATLKMDYLYPSATDKFDLVLDTFMVGLRGLAATRFEYTNVLMERVRLQIPVLPPFDDTPYTYALYAEATHDSGAPLLMNFAELTLVAWR